MLGRGAVTAPMQNSAMTTRLSPFAIVAYADEEPATVTPAALATIGGGALGIFGAAYCTSTGSPPTGLAVGIATILLVSLGAGYLEQEQ